MTKKEKMAFDECMKKIVENGAEQAFIWLYGPKNGQAYHFKNGKCETLETDENMHCDSVFVNLITMKNGKMYDYSRVF